MLGSDTCCYLHACTKEFFIIFYSRNHTESRKRKGIESFLENCVLFIILQNKTLEVEKNSEDSDCLPHLLLSDDVSSDQVLRN